ncbi:MAG: DNA gyrase inhibitor YacG [Bdellovibrionaceae bacterium]|nr:DNA gyrase inhibitor YacG [Pseudobdellovibrionaceae bacterium]
MKKVNCPQCGKNTIYSLENDSRPFCSERCKLIDLGEWAEESHRIPTEEMPTEEDFHKNSNENFSENSHPWLH